MPRQSVAWNKDRTKSVVLSKLKEFTINEHTELLVGSGVQISTTKFYVRGWFNLENSFLFGEFDDKPAAEEFLEMIHGMFN